MKGLLLAGGYGTRLRPLTFTGNKHILPIANKPMLFYGLEHLINAGISEIGVIIGPHKKDIIEALGNGSKFGVKITYIEQPTPLGLAHAIMLAEQFIAEEPFVMYLGDNLLKQGIEPLIKEFTEGPKDCIVGISYSNTPSNYGVVVFDQNEKIITLIEKPKKYVSNWALIGVYVFNSSVFEALKNIKPSERGEFEITDTIKWLHQTNHKVGVIKVQGWWKDTGKTLDILEANQLVLKDQKTSLNGNISTKAKINHNVKIGKDTTIGKGVIINGPVIIGENCTITNGAIIGPYTSIADNVQIKHAIISNSIIMEKTIIDCDIRLTDSLIGREVIVKTKDKDPNEGHVLILGDKTTVLI